MLQEQKQMGNAFYEQYEMHLETEEAVGYCNTQESFDIKARGEKLQKELADRLRKLTLNMLTVFEALQCLLMGEDIQILTPEARQGYTF